MPTPEPLSEPLRNAFVRDVDWRFLLRQPEVPRAVDLTSGRHSRGLGLVCEPAPEVGHTADLAVVGFPTRAALRSALEALRPGGEVVCLWRWPLPGGIDLARRRIERAGFFDARVYWPGPVPHRPPQFWLPLGVPAAAAHVLADRPPQSSFHAVLRPIWRAAVRFGGLAPLCAIARTSEGPAGSSGPAEPIEARLGGESSWMLLTGGNSIINKVVGLPFVEGRSTPPVVVKFARIPEVEERLEREAEVLSLLEGERPEVDGIPRVRARFRRAGRLAVAEGALFGRSLLPVLSPANFSEHALRVTRWLIELAGDGPRQPAAEWWPRLVGEPLERFEYAFGRVLGRESVARAHRLLEGLGDLPLAVEHRDCAPWNIVLTDSDGPAVLDWESAQSRGLPACDLVYFLATAAFVLENSIESGRIRETYSTLLDPSSPYGRVTATCLEEYSARLGLDRETMRRLRLLCWIVRCQSYAPGDAPREQSGVWTSQTLGGIEGPDTMEKVSLRLVEEELRRAS